MLSNAGGAEAQLKEQKEEKKDAMVSNYWGISRPKITREDGSEWPWNCFMVEIFLHSHISIFSRFFLYNSKI